MKQALVVHPRLTVYGGGEIVALHSIKALQELDFEVTIVTDNFNPSQIESNYHMGEVLRKCKPIIVPRFKPLTSRFLALQRLPYSRLVARASRNLRPDVVLSTQSVIYSVPGVRTYQIVYDIADLFEIVPGGRFGGPLASGWKKPYYSMLRLALPANLIRNTIFIPLSHSVERELSARHLRHSPVVYSPCDMIFALRTKKSQVCLVSRIAPQKNIGDFMKIAALVPEYKFILVGARAGEPEYETKVLSHKPRNVEYIEVRIRERPELVEDSRVYLYTSLEPGIGIALGQAMGAGCVPVTPAWGGGAEMVHDSGVGHTYRTLEEAAGWVREVLDTRNQPHDDPSYVASMSMIFSSDEFRERIKAIVTRQSPNGSGPSAPIV